MASDIRIFHAGQDTGGTGWRTGGQYRYNCTDAAEPLDTIDWGAEAWSCGPLLVLPCCGCALCPDPGQGQLDASKDTSLAASGIRSHTGTPVNCHNGCRVAAGAGAKTGKECARGTFCI